MVKVIIGYTDFLNPKTNKPYPILEETDPVIRELESKERAKARDDERADRLYNAVWGKN